MWLILVFVVSFLVTFFLTPVLIRKLRAAGMVGVDVHKERKTRVAEMGGLAIIFGLSTGVFVSIPFFSNGFIYLFAAFLVILITALIGICDDIFGVKQRVKAILPVFASIPLVVTQAGVHTMTIPFVGNVNFGLLYPLVLIPLGVTGAANAFNMLAGYNGLESGLAAIACFFLGVVGILLGRLEVSILMFAMSGACLGFLKYNYFPAKVFPGDVGTFTMGTAIAAAVIIGNMETIGIIVLGPHVINGLITVFDLLRGKPIEKFSKVRGGVLVPPSTKYVYNLYYLLEKVFRLTEKKLVWVLWVLGFIFGLLGLGFLFFLA